MNALPAPLNDYFFVKSGVAFKKIHFQDILYLESALNYSTVYTADQKYMVRGNLKQVQDWLPEGHFIRIHKCFIVNKERITSFNYSSVQIEGQEIPIGRRHKDNLFQEFKIAK